MRGDRGRLRANTQKATTLFASRITTLRCVLRNLHKSSGVDARRCRSAFQYTIELMPSSATGFRPPAPAPQERPLGLFALMRTLRANALECWTREHFEKPIVVGGFPFAPVAVVSDPAAIRQILIEDQSTYQKSTLERRVLSARLRNGLVAVDGEQWQRLRRTLAPMFAGKTMSGYAREIGRAASDLVERWSELPNGSVVVVKTEMLRLALDVLLRCIFTDGIGNAEAVRDATTRFYSTCGTLDPLDVIGVPDFVPRLSRFRERPVMQEFDRGLSIAIAERRRELSNPPRDMLGAMLAARDPESGQSMTDTEVKDNVMTFIFGGQETTSSALTWAIFLLSQCPEWRERVLEEAEHLADADADEALERLVVTRAVVEEALRVYPPIIAITRTAVRHTEIEGHAIKRGSLVVVSPYVVHRHRSLWRDPALFDPTRFLSGASEKIARYSYLPFGVGPRACVGSVLAVQEATITLAALTANFTLELAPGEVVWPAQKNFTMRPRSGLLMTVTRRRTSPRG
jgi:cytochrome P450